MVLCSNPDVYDILGGINHCSVQMYGIILNVLDCRLTLMLQLIGCAQYAERNRKSIRVNDVCFVLCVLWFNGNYSKM